MYSEIVNKLRAEAAKSELRIKTTEDNLAKAKKLSSYIESCEDSIRACNYVLKQIEPKMADLQKYLTDKADTGKAAINHAIAVAGDIIPDSMRGVQFQIEGDTAWLEVSDMSVDSVEGSGYKGVASMFIQSEVVKQTPNILQTIIFDEPLAGVSVSNSVSVSACLPYMCEGLQVILIEQKPEVFVNFNHTVYNFFKDEDGVRLERGDFGDEAGRSLQN